MHAALTGCRINRLSRVGRVTGEPIRRYSHDRHCSLIHVDVTKFGDIPEDGGWRHVGKQQGDHNRNTTPDRTGERSRKYYAKVGTAFVHTIMDDHSRVAYAEIQCDEKTLTATGVLKRAAEWFVERGVTIG